VGCNPQGIYRPRKPQATYLYRLVEDTFDQLERVWDERYENSTASGAADRQALTGMIASLQT
jgi:hypothetical protein